MSIKTLRKRIALVAVVALGFGLISTTPSLAGDATTITSTVSVTNGVITVVSTSNDDDDEANTYIEVLASADSDIPTGFGLKVVLSSSYAPGTALVSQEISLATNGVTGATAGRSGTYQPISATFPAVVSASDTYTAYVNITY
jgi:hypothetical protein